LMCHQVSAETQAPHGITVSPAFQQVAIQADQTEKTITFVLTNNEAVAETLKFTTQDFNTLDESGGLFFVGTNPTQLQKKYGLARWLSLSQSQATIGPHQTLRLTADVINLSTMPAGGHYGALLIGIGGDSGASGNNVALHPVASSLLFVTKLGGDTHFLKLTDVYLNRRLFALPSSVTLRFRDDGNTHLIPRGFATITGPSSKIVRRGTVNENSGIILPQTYRRYGVQLADVSKSYLPGHYKLMVSFRFDGINQFRLYQISFWVFPTAALVAIGATALIATLAGYFAFKRYQKNLKRKKFLARSARRKAE